MSLKNGCNNLYLHNKLFKITLKPNSCLTFFCRDLANPSTLLTFPNINLKKTVGNLHVVSNITEKSCNNLYFHLKVFHRSSKSNSHVMSVSRRAPKTLSSGCFSNNGAYIQLVNLPFIYFEECSSSLG